MKLFLKIILFLCCLASLLISLQIFYNQGIVADEWNLHAQQLYGGTFWLYMNWLRMLLLLLATILTAIHIFPHKKSTV